MLRFKVTIAHVNIAVGVMEWYKIPLKCGEAYGRSQVLYLLFSSRNGITKTNISEEIWKPLQQRQCQTTFGKPFGKIICS